MLPEVLPTHESTEVGAVPTVVISVGGTHTYSPGQIEPGDTVTCVAGGGGTVPDNGEGVGASSGFRAWTDAAGMIHVKCPQHLGNI